MLKSDEMNMNGADKVSRRINMLAEDAKPESLADWEWEVRREIWRMADCEVLNLFSERVMPPHSH